MFSCLCFNFMDYKQLNIHDVCQYPVLISYVNQQTEKCYHSIKYSCLTCFRKLNTIETQIRKSQSERDIPLSCFPSNMILCDFQSKPGSQSVSLTHCFYQPFHGLIFLRVGGALTLLALIRPNDRLAGSSITIPDTCLNSRPIELY